MKTCDCDIRDCICQPNEGIAMKTMKAKALPCDCHEQEVETGIGMFPNGIKFCPLHAAAPDLLLELKGMVDSCEAMLEELDPAYVTQFDGGAEQLERVKRLIASAEGAA